MKPALIYYKENVFSQLDYFQNIRLATSGHTVDERFYLTFNDLSESYNKEEITAIFIMNTLSDNAIELQGLQMAHYIRIITRGEGVGKLPIFLIGSENITELLRLSDYSSILQTPAVELLPYSKEKVKNVIDNIHTYKHLENYEGYLKKTHIPQPNNYLSHHSITSEWSLYQWSKCLNIKSAIENHIERNLYYRYVTSQHPECGDKVTIDYPPYPSESESEKKRILIIDDEADKGWGELYKRLFSHYSNIEVNTLKGFDYASDTKEALLPKVKETIEENMAIAQRRGKSRGLGWGVREKDRELFREALKELNISLTTVITHRKNITEKLGIKSVSGLTIYAVMNGYIEADRI